MTRPHRKEKHARGIEAGFLCENCGRPVVSAAPGTGHRNHCPHCLFSLHVDMITGDRRSGCHGNMAPIAVTASREEWSLVHRCRRCGLIRVNRVCGDDNALLLVSLALKPLANPPFPLESLAALPGSGEGGDR